MKNLKEIIQEKLNRTKSSLMIEKLKINSKSKINQYNYHPKSTTELRKILLDLLEKRGENANLNDIDTSNITFMDSLFSDSVFNGDISGWDVSKVEHMKDMFLKSPLEKNPPKWYHE